MAKAKVYVKHSGAGEALTNITVKRATYEIDSINKLMILYSGYDDPRSVAVVNLDSLVAIVFNDDED